MNDPNLQRLLLIIDESLSNTEFIKLTLSSKKDTSGEVKNIYAKVVSIKAGTLMSIVFRYPTKDVTKNFTFDEGIELIKTSLEKDFMQAILLTANKDVHFMQFPNGKSTIKQQEASQQLKLVFLHDKQKTLFISPENNLYLQLLGVTTVDGKIKKGMEDKFRQINKYVEVVSHVVEQANMPAGFTVADMGSGKGYLTFALYDYLTNKMSLSPEVVGVELRPNLVAQCNGISKKSGFEKLKFIQGSIEKTVLPELDLLIALHACDTATDEAIFRGIRQKAKVIITAPCCHKQIRRQMNPDNALAEITKYGILEERQAEMLTDAIRALILEAYGYSTKVFEFISTEHTPKNVLIVAVKKSGEDAVNQEKLDNVQALKKLFGIEFHFLEKLLETPSL
ncbi:MAG: SAM-dependent methyltransferase [Bacteroidales bacterium]|nr:SAM-dependent methyltransferase [Bacteroidales bacterium]